MTAGKLTSMVPQLRFPEFHDTGEWEVEQLGSVCELYQPETLAASRLKQDGPYLVYGANGVIGKHDRYNHEDSEVVVTCRGATCGEVNRTQPKSWITGNAMVVRPKDDRISKDFVFYLLKSDGLKFVVSGSAQPQITRAGFSPFLFVFPERKKEQQCIADCLGSLDGLIAAQGRKLEILRQHKQGLMQQLFPRPGETAPQLRFPEFHDAGEWDHGLLKDFVKSIRTGKLDANAMVEGGKYRFYTCAKNYYWINDYAFDGEALLIAGNGAYLGYIHHYTGKFNAYQRTYVLQDFEIDVPFLKSFLDRKLPARIQMEKKDGNTPYIVLATIADMPLLIPPTVAEQQRIADCLGWLDGLIAAQGRKLETLRQHKQGLMQQLFPSPESR